MKRRAAANEGPMDGQRCCPGRHSSMRVARAKNDLDLCFYDGNAKGRSRFDEGVLTGRLREG